jgi:hypothetical protein
MTPAEQWALLRELDRRREARVPGRG